MEPLPPLGRRSTRRLRPNRPQIAGRFILIGSVLAASILASSGVDFYTDWLWFSALGYVSMFSTILSIQVALFATGALAFGLIFGLNAILARRLASALEH